VPGGTCSHARPSQQPEIGSFRLHLAAEGKAAKTIRNYVEAVQWFAAACLRRQTLRTRWEQVDGQDIERWMVHLLGRYSHAYASNQYRALQRFFKWWAAEEELPDPMARLHPPNVTGGGDAGVRHSPVAGFERILRIMDASALCLPGA
jgi:site-specific recombinase XerD